MSDVSLLAPSALPAPFLPALLDMLSNGVLYYLPLRDATGTIVDFRFGYFNSAAQQLLTLPAEPATTYLEQWPGATDSGTFAFLRDAILSDTPTHRNEFYPIEDRTICLRVQARRLDAGLLVTFTECHEQSSALAEETLRQSRTREQEARAEAERQRGELQRVFEQAPVAIAVYRGPTHIIEFANTSTYAIWGRPYKKGLGKPLLELLPEITGQGFDELLDQVRTTEEPYRGYSMPSQIQRNGQLETVYWDFVYVPMYDADGTAYGVLTVAMEVTEQVLTRQLAEEKERQTNYLNEELQAANEEILANNQELERTQAELRLLNEDLEARVLERTYELRHAQANERIARQQAEAQHQLLHRVFEQSPIALCVMRGPTHIIDVVNPLAARIIGHPRKQLLGQPYADAVAKGPAQESLNLLQQVWESGEAVTLQDYAIRLGNSPSEKVGYYNLVYQPLRDDQGQVASIACVAINVTSQVIAREQVQSLNEELAAINEELQVTNEELNDTNTRLLRTNADLDNFIYTASHDLKAPITNIEGLLRLLEDLLPASVRGDELLMPVLTRMQESIERFTRTIAHLTDVSKLQLEFAHPAATTALFPVLNDVQQDLQPLFAQTGGEMSIDVDGCRTLFISEKNLRSVLYNLVSNALKYRHPARPPHVRISCRREDGRSILQVEDNGMGLTPRQQGKLFQLFERLHTHVEGTGVGLYMVKKMVENAGGTIIVQSQENQGTSFIMSFPR